MAYTEEEIEEMKAWFRKNPQKSPRDEVQAAAQPAPTPQTPAPASAAKQPSLKQKYKNLLQLNLPQSQIYQSKNMNQLSQSYNYYSIINEIPEENNKIEKNYSANYFSNQTNMGKIIDENNNLDEILVNYKTNLSDFLKKKNKIKEN